MNYKVIVDASNGSGRLLPGMTATIEFIVERRDDVLRASNVALKFEPGQTGGFADGGSAAMGARRDEGKGRVYVLGKNGLPEAVDVALGMTDGKRTELKEGSGPAEGTMVITGVNKEPEVAASKGFKLPKPPDDNGPPPI